MTTDLEQNSPELSQRTNNVVTTELNAGSEQNNFYTSKEHYSMNQNNIKPEPRFKIENELDSTTKVSISTIDDQESLRSSDSDSENEEIPDRELVLEAFKNGPSSNGVVVVGPHAPSSQPVGAIGSIAVQNSSDITFGNKTFYQGPVTIKQFHLDSNKWKSKELSSYDNPSFSNRSYETDAVPGGSSGEAGSSSSTDKFAVLKKKPNIYILIGAITLLLILIATIVALTIKWNSSLPFADGFKPGDGDDSRKNIAINSTIGDDLLVNHPPVLRLVTRDEWIAQPPAHELTKLIPPVGKVIISHTATDNCSTQASCTLRVRLIQTFHMESRNWDDIGYNFLVGGDGSVYEGRGWDNQGAHTKGFNFDSIGISFIGTFNSILPPVRQIEVAKLLIQEGVKEKKVAENYKLYGHRQLAPFESPGAKLYENIKTWPHWSNDRDDLYGPAPS